MVINATLSNCTLGKPLFISSNQVSFIFESAKNDILTISTLPEQSFKAIAQMISGFFEKGSNMYGFRTIVVKTPRATLTAYPKDTSKHLEELLIRLTNISAYIWEDSDD